MMTERELKLFEELELGFCGCGDPKGALLFLRDVLQCFADRRTKRGDWDAQTKRLHNLLQLEENRFLGLSYLYFIDNLGLLEHGTHITGSWLTERGEEVLDALRTIDLKKMMEQSFDYQHFDIDECQHCRHVSARLKRHSKAQTLDEGQE